MKAIITGSFDPITIGHLEIIKKASTFFDELYVVALLNSEKEYMFTLEEKKEIMKLSLAEFKNIIIDAYDGLTADYM
ncbi:MAG: adenylyltransferase/cytidyltransferase family protein, partial [Clostridia bacterium]|nr:adenylyltransferase/cytidyltransferase family protein [Clostridia bacterium]